jgi:hypothetical protein
LTSEPLYHNRFLSSREERLNAAKIQEEQCSEQIRSRGENNTACQRITSFAGTVSETIPAREKAVRRNCTVRLSVRMPSWLMRHGELSPPHPGRDHLHVPRAHAPRPPAGCACGATKPTNITASLPPPARFVVTREPCHSVRGAHARDLLKFAPDATPFGNPGPLASYCRQLAPR